MDLSIYIKKLDLMLFVHFTASSSAWVFKAQPDTAYKELNFLELLACHWFLEIC